MNEDKIKDSILDTFEQIMQRMPKNEAQKIRWCNETVDEFVNLLACNGIDLYTQLGMLEKIKYVILKNFNKASENVDILFGDR